jgi:hypothetical protein
VLAAAAYSTVVRGFDDEAAALAEAALRDGVPTDSPAPGLADNALAYLDGHTGNGLRAVQRIEDFLASPAADLIDPHEEVSFLAIAAGWAQGRGDVDKAQALAVRALEAARRTRTPSAIASSLFVYGYTLELVDPDAALVALDECLALTEIGATPVVFGWASSYTARIRARRGDHVGAARALRDAIKHTEHIGDRVQFNGVLVSGTVVFSMLGKHDLVAQIEGHITDVISAYVDDGEDPGRSELLGAYATARDVLGASHATAVAAGAALSHDEMAQLLLDNLERILHELGG